MPSQNSTTRPQVNNNHDSAPRDELITKPPHVAEHLPSNSAFTTSRLSRSRDQSREASPSPTLRSPPILQPLQDAQQQPVNVKNTPSRLPTTSASITATQNAPRLASSSNGVSSKASKNLSRDRSQLSSITDQDSTSPRSQSPATSRRNSVASVKQPAETEPGDLEVTPKASRMMAPSPQERKSRSPPPPTQTFATNGKLPRQFSSIASALETVEEGDLTGSPQDEPMSNSISSLLERQSSQVTIPADLRSLDSAHETTESEADTGRSRERSRQSPTQQVTQSQPPPSSKAQKPATARMIVETETVPSIPQTSSVAANDKPGGGHRDHSGSLRTKPSTETIRPKKDRKKITQKRPSVVSGSKAEMFEAKVASAADDEESSSDEAFVYESNPPESRPRQNRHHSRTPSGASLRSMGDRRHAGRAISNIIDSHRGPKAKRSMKFASSTYIAGSGDEDAGRDQGTVRAHKPRPLRLDDPQNQHHHGPWASSDWTPNGLDSPFSAASKSRFSGPNSRRQSPRDTPKHSPPPYSPTRTKGRARSPTNLDFDRNGSANEQEPLLGSLRTSRTRPLRNTRASDLRHVDFLESQQRPWARRCPACVILLVMLLFLLIFGVGALFATNKPLYDVNLSDIQNVLASEEELMLDLNVAAVNPNILAISTLELDVNIFAKSRYIGTEDYWRHCGAAEPKPQNPLLSDQPLILRPPHIRPASYDTGHLRPTSSRDDGTSPPSNGDLEGDPHTMLLGRILHFDSPLTFDSSPLMRASHNSTGSLRLPKPGNKTEVGGSERWEKVIQHPFTLIVRGVLRYQLPIGSGRVSAILAGSTNVSMEADGSVPDMIHAQIDMDLDLDIGVGTDVKSEAEASMARVTLGTLTRRGRRKRRETRSS